MERLKIFCENTGAPHQKNLINPPTPGFLGSLGTLPPSFEKKSLLNTPDGPETSPSVKQQILEASRTAYFDHRQVCLVCSTGWAASDICTTHAELWQAYEAALIGVHGVHKVLGCEELQEGAAFARAGVVAPAPSTNGYRIVPTAQIRPPAWHKAQDAYHSHLMTCGQCKPSGQCTIGSRLSEELAQRTEDRSPNSD